MSYKVCVYKNCDNYIYDGTPSGNKQFKIFRFPKDPVRYKDWMMRGEVLQGLPQSQMYMCSEHFDQKYLMKNLRRTMLTSSAVPFPYCEKNIKDLQVEDNASDIVNKNFKSSFDKAVDTSDTEMVFSIQGDLNHVSASIRLKESICNVGDDDGDAVGILEYFKDNDNSNAEYCVESTTTATKEPEQELTEIEEIYTEMSEDELLTEIVTRLSERDKNSRPNAGKKRKMHSEDTDEEPSSSKHIKTKIRALCESKNVSSANANTTRTVKVENMATDTHIALRTQNENHNAPSLQIDPEALVDTKWITDFIFKGEEYVQMPKEYYVHEKMELMQRLRKYENVLKRFKNNLQELDLP